MSEARVLAPPSRDWSLRPFEAVRVAPFWVGVAIATVYLLVATLFAELVGLSLWLRFQGVPFYRSPLWLLDILNGVILAYIPTANAYTRRGALRDLADLRPVLRCDDAQFEALVARVTGVSALSLALAGVPLAAAFAAMVFLDPSFWIYGPPQPGSPLFLWVLGRNTLTGWLAGHAVATEVHVSWAYQRIGCELTEIDLLDLRPLRPFARKSQRCALTWILLSSLISLYWLAPSAAGRSNPFILAATLAAVAAGVITPVYGVHRRIRALKTAELDRLRGLIRAERDGLAAAAAPGGGRLADLVAYRDLVERVREWPFDAPTLLRFALYAGLGIGSWLGGALVERFVDTALR